MSHHEVMITVLPGRRLDRRNAAAALGRKPKTLANWKSKGIGPRCFSVLGRCYYDLDEIESNAHGMRVERRVL